MPTTPVQVVSPMRNTIAREEDGSPKVKQVCRPHLSSSNALPLQNMVNTKYGIASSISF